MSGRQLRGAPKQPQIRSDRMGIAGPGVRWSCFELEICNKRSGVRLGSDEKRKIVSASLVGSGVEKCDARAQLLVSSFPAGKLCNELVRLLLFIPPIGKDFGQSCTLRLHIHGRSQQRSPEIWCLCWKTKTLSGKACIVRLQIPAHHSGDAARQIGSDLVPKKLEEEGSQLFVRLRSHGSSGSAYHPCTGQSCTTAKQRLLKKNPKTTLYVMCVASALQAF